ncbi:hypothetical protein [Tropheryma whipplei]|uniref:hypothetical protein n=1 Tax=Tropheryma whipplei TaxID=2039 RepID=UPI0002E90314|nr:hypothetical protein [Tropheryma whipplei]
MSVVKMRILAALLTIPLMFLIAIGPVSAETQHVQETAIRLTADDTNQIIKELEQAGFTKQVTGNKRQETITLTKDGVTVTLTHVTQQTQTRLSWGDDPWGFYIKLEWHEQVALAAGTLAAGGGAGLALKAALKIAVKAGTAFLAGLEVVDKLSDIIGAGPCPPFQPRYIRFDPFRTKCN